MPAVLLALGKIRPSSHYLICKVSESEKQLAWLSIPVTCVLGGTLEPWKFKFNLNDTFRVNWMALHVPYSWQNIDGSGHAHMLIISAVLEQ